MKLSWKWAIAGAAVLALGAGVAQSLSARKAQQQAVADAAKVKTVTVVELAPSDVTRAQTRELAQGLPLTGTLKAVNSAMLKARVAGELQALTVREGDNVKAGQVLARIEARLACARPKTRLMPPRPKWTWPCVSTTTTARWLIRALSPKPRSTPRKPT